MRICLFTTTFLPLVGGAERSADLVARGLIARGHEVGVLAQWSGQGPEGLPYPVWHYRRMPRQHWWPEALAWPLWRVHRRWPFDLVLAFDSYPAGYAATWWKRFGGGGGVPVVTLPRGGDVQNGFFALQKVRVGRCLANGYRRSDRIIAISQWVKQRVEELGGGPGVMLPPIDVVYNGIDLEAFDREREAARAAKVEMPVRGKFGLHLARVNPHKQQVTAVRAVHLLREEFRKRGMQYVIAGDGRGMKEVRELVKELGLEETVLCVGTRQGLEKAWLLDRAEFFVSASLSEGFGNVLIEALAAGLPIVASDIPTHREVVPGEAGVFFRVGDAGDLAEKMLGVMEGTAGMRAASLAARGRYGLGAMIEGYERACREALMGRGVV